MEITRRTCTRNRQRLPGTEMRTISRKKPHETHERISDAIDEIVLHDPIAATR